MGEVPPMKDRKAGRRNLFKIPLMKDRSGRRNLKYFDLLGDLKFNDKSGRRDLSNGVEVPPMKDRKSGRRNLFKIPPMKDRSGRRNLKDLLAGLKFNDKSGRRLMRGEKKNLLHDLA